METQQDTKVRMVALTNLRAMCKRISGMCHRWEVTKVSRSRVHVTYSNPDEYGHERPVTAVYPCWPSKWPDDAENPRVALAALRYTGGADSEDCQAFMALTDCPDALAGCRRQGVADARRHREGRPARGQAQRAPRHLRRLRPGKELAMRTVKLADIQVTYREHEIPLTCPQCGADLCAKEAFKTWEYSCDSAHVTVEADGTVGRNDSYDWDYGAGDNFVPHALTCANCSLEIAGGAYGEGGEPNPDRTVAGPSKGYQGRL